MKPEDKARFNRLYEQNLQAPRPQGLRHRTIDSYSRSLCRAARFFDRCPDDLSTDELKRYFSALLDKSYSWSRIKVDLCGLKFFHRHVLNSKMEWVKIMRPPHVRTLPDIPTREEVQRLINAVRKLRYRMFLLTVYSMGLRISEGLALEVGDIEGAKYCAHIHDAKGDRDRYAPLPQVALSNLRLFWTTHHQPTTAVLQPGG